MCLFLQASATMSNYEPPPGRVAAIDYGTVRIGIAISDTRRTMASPYENYNRATPERDAARFRRLVEEERIRLFVVGLPVHLAGHESQKSHESRQFGAWLQEATGVEVVYFDERFTTADAMEQLQQAGLTKKRRKERLDMLAAQGLLAAFLESGGAGHTPGPIEDD